MSQEGNMGGEENYSKMYTKIGLWGGGLVKNKYWRANLLMHHVFQGKKNILLWPGRGPVGSWDYCMTRRWTGFG